LTTFKKVIEWEYQTNSKMAKKQKIKYISEGSEAEGPKEKKTGGLRRKLKECQKERREYLTQTQKAVADLINYRKRQELASEEWRKYGQRELLENLLPVIDALSAGAGKDAGLKKIKEQLEKVLIRNGLKEIAVLGEKFNPEFHEAVDMAEAKEASWTIIAEIQKGYLLHNKVLRPSKVRVAK